MDPPSAVVERLEAFGAEVLAEAVNRPVQVVNGGLYLRGLIEQGPRKSLEPLVERLGGEADYQSMQQFLAVSPWDPALVVKATASGSRRRLRLRRGCWMTPGFRRTGRTRRGSSVSTRARWGRLATVRSGCRCTRSAATGRCRWGGRCTCPRTGARTRRGARRRRSPRRSSFAPSRSSGCSCGTRCRLEGPQRAGARRPGVRR